jgi:hypothetical protein
VLVQGTSERAQEGQTRDIIVKKRARFLSLVWM